MLMSRTKENYKNQIFQTAKMQTHLSFLTILLQVVCDQLYQTLEGGIEIKILERHSYRKQQAV